MYDQRIEIRALLGRKNLIYGLFVIDTRRESINRFRGQGHDVSLAQAVHGLLRCDDGHRSKRAAVCAFAPDFQIGFEPGIAFQVAVLDFFAPGKIGAYGSASISARRPARNPSWL